MQTSILEYSSWFKRFVGVLKEKRLHPDLQIIEKGFYNTDSGRWIYWVWVLYES